MGYIINLGGWQSIFALPCDIVDKHLRLAGESGIKALLYILRHAGRDISCADIAEAIGVPEDEIPDAVGYWIDCGILRDVSGNLYPSPEAAQPDISEEPEPRSDPGDAVAEEDHAAPDIPAQAQEKTPAVSTPKKHERVRYSYDECMTMMSDDSELRQMLIILEGLMSKQLNHTEIAVFITLVKWYGLPPRCVIMLVEYCHSIGKRSIAYIESTGIGWADEEVTTIERANEKILHLRSLNSAWSTVREAIGIPERKPTKREEEYCNIWINDYKMPIDLIRLAYDRCVDKNGKLSMGYMNGIIKNWNKNGITTVAQALDESKPAAERGTDTGRYKPTYDKSEIENMLDDDFFSDNGDQ